MNNCPSETLQAIDRAKTYLHQAYNDLNFQKYDEEGAHGARGCLDALRKVLEDTALTEVRTRCFLARYPSTRIAPPPAPGPDLPAPAEQRADLTQLRKARDARKAALAAARDEKKAAKHENGRAEG